MAICCFIWALLPLSKILVWACYYVLFLNCVIYKVGPLVVVGYGGGKIWPHSEHVFFKSHGLPIAVGRPLSVNNFALVTVLRWPSSLWASCLKIDITFIQSILILKTYLRKARQNKNVIFLSHLCHLKMIETLVKQGNWNMACTVYM